MVKKKYIKRPFPRKGVDWNEIKRKKKMNNKLLEYRARILKEIDFIDVKPHSHNIISLNLRIIHREFGAQEAEKAIDDFNLEELLGISKF